MVVAVFFSRAIRRRSQASRAAGSITTSTIEEGMDNVLARQSLGGNEKEKDRFGGDSSESFSRHRALQLLFLPVKLANRTGHLRLTGKRILRLENILSHGTQLQKQQTGKIRVILKPSLEMQVSLKTAEWFLPLKEMTISSL